MTIKAGEFDHLVKKLGLETKDTGDRHAWFLYEGRIITRTKRSHGKGDIPMHNKVRTQLKMDEEQFRKAVRCHLTREEYIEILRHKGLISPT
jgi:hypothetical protein